MLGLDVTIDTKSDFALGLSTPLKLPKKFLNKMENYIVSGI